MPIYKHNTEIDQLKHYGKSFEILKYAKYRSVNFCILALTILDSLDTSQLTTVALKAQRLINQSQEK